MQDDPPPHLPDAGRHGRRRPRVQSPEHALVPRRQGEALQHAHLSIEARGGRRLHPHLRAKAKEEEAHFAKVCNYFLWVGQNFLLNEKRATLCFTVVCACDFSARNFWPKRHTN